MSHTEHEPESRRVRLWLLLSLLSPECHILPSGRWNKKACGELHSAPTRHTATIYVNEKIMFVIMNS